MARIDSLHVFLTALGCYVLYFYRGAKAAALSALIFTAAFFTKQSALLMALPVMAACFISHRRDAVYAGALFAGLTLALCLIADAHSGGWFNFYVFELPAAHRIDWRNLGSFWTRDALRPFGLATLCALLALILMREDGRHKIGWYVALAAGFIGASYVSRLHSFGHVNVLITMHFVLALLAGMALTKAKEANSPYLQTALALALCLQFIALYYPASPFIPDDKARAKGEAFVQTVAGIEGDVLITELQYMQSKIGKRPFSYGMSGYDLMRAKLGEKEHVRADYARALREAIAAKQFSAIITGKFLKLPGLQEHYVLQREIKQPSEFVTGAVFMDKGFVYVPKP